MYEWIIVAVAILILLLRAVRSTGIGELTIGEAINKIRHPRKCPRREALAARAEQQNSWMAEGDIRGIYGENYPVPDLDAVGTDNERQVFGWPDYKGILTSPHAYHLHPDGDDHMPCFCKRPPKYDRIDYGELMSQVEDEKRRQEARDQEARDHAKKMQERIDYANHRVHEIRKATDLGSYYLTQGQGDRDWRLIHTDGTVLGRFPTQLAAMKFWNWNERTHA